MYEDYPSQKIYLMYMRFAPECEETVYNPLLNVSTLILDGSQS